MEIFRSRVRVKIRVMEETMREFRVIRVKEKKGDFCNQKLNVCASKVMENAVDEITNVSSTMNNAKNDIIMNGNTVVSCGYGRNVAGKPVGVLTPVRGESLKILNGFDVSLPVSHSLWSSQSFGHQKAINGFDMPLPVAVCSGLVNPLAPRKGKFHGGLITMSTLCT
ncbi:hypothetical protein Tco_0900004 [Tanacetum coccineum]